MSFKLVIYNEIQWDYLMFIINLILHRISKKKNAVRACPAVMMDFQSKLNNVQLSAIKAHAYVLVVIQPFIKA